MSVTSWKSPTKSVTQRLLCIILIHYTYAAITPLLCIYQCSSFLALQVLVFRGYSSLIAYAFTEDFVFITCNTHTCIWLLDTYVNMCVIRAVLSVFVFVCNSHMNIWLYEHFKQLS